MIQSISCKRFRRFENLDPIELKGVNFFVGANNSGKSTLVKEILLLQHNLNYNFGMDPKLKLPLFDLSFNNAHIGDFYRAFHKSEKNIDNTIEFCWTNEDNVTVQLEICKSSIGNAFACYKSITYISYEPYIYMNIDYENRFCSYVLGNPSYKKNNYDYDLFNAVLNLIKPKDKEINELEDLLIPYDDQEDSKDIQQKIDAIYSLKSDVHYLKNNNAHLISDFFDTIKEKLYIERKFTISEDKEICASIQNIITIVEDDLYYINYLTDDETNEFYYYDSPEWMRIRDVQRYDFSNVKYVYAHSVHQNSFYSVLDKNDIVAQAINEYHKCFIVSEHKSDKFLNYWLNQLDIGKSITIIPISGGEIYKAFINTKDDFKIPIQDLGMGSIQVVVLLLKIAVFFYNNTNDFLVVEEPEQNLHPKLQSKLAELFTSIFYLKNNLKCKIIIETHSEYIVRRTQSIIADNGLYANGKWIEVKYEDNPFQVYYFPEEGQPYSLGYKESGLFKRSFGEGFFDESSRLLTPVLRKARRTK